MTGSPFFMTSSMSTSSVPVPQHFWPMQEGTGTTFSSIVGAALPMTRVGWSWSTSGRNGTNCISFAQFQRAYLADPFYYEVFSLCVWIYPTTTNAHMIIANKRNDSNGTASTLEFDFYIGPDNLLHFLKWDSVGAVCLLVDGTTVVPQNAWSHVAAVSGGAGQEGSVYLNGTSVGTATQTGAMMNSGSVFQIGGRSANNDARYFIGRMQEVRMYNTAVSPVQMSAIVGAATP